MRVAIASAGNSTSSVLDKHFGRCSHFIIYDTDTGSTEIIPNPFAEAEENSGPSALGLLITKNIHKIVSGEFGIKIKTILDSHRIQMIVIKTPGIRVQAIIDMLTKRQD